MPTPTTQAAEAEIPTTQRRFKMLLHVAKAEQRDGEWWLDAVATGSQEDLYGDIMGEDCVRSMVRQFNAGTLPLRNSHYTDWDGDMGWIMKGQLTPGGDASIEVLLDQQHADTAKLIRSLTGIPGKTMPRKLGVSIGGMVDWEQVTWETRDGKNVRVIHDIVLDHVAVTSRPAYPNAMIDGVTQKDFAFPWYTGIRKALDSLQAALPQPPADAGAPPHAEGGTPVTDVQKATDATADPPADSGAAADTPAECPGMAGTWKAIDEVDQNDQVLVFSNAPDPSTQETTDMTDDKAAAAPAAGITPEQLAEALTKASEAGAANMLKLLGIDPAQLQKADDPPAGTVPDRTTAVQKGVRSDAAPTRDATTSPIATLKSSEDYAKASPFVRQQMLAKALKTGLGAIANA